MDTVSRVTGERWQSTEACSLPYGPFVVRFTGRLDCAPITALQWRALIPFSRWYEMYRPQCIGGEFVDVRRDTAIVWGDTLFCGLSRSAENFTVVGGVVSQYVNPTPAFVSASGTFLLEARARDAFGFTSEFETYRLTLNLDPETGIQRRLMPPASHRSFEDSSAAGWITGNGNYILPRGNWIPFADGDTIPLGSRVRCFARGRDDPRDRAIDSLAGKREVRFTYRYDWRARTVSNSNMPFSPAFEAADFTLPEGGTWRGGSIEWLTCPLSYTFFASAEDEHGRLDGTPDSLRFHVGYPPVIEQLDVPAVIVFVPCIESQLCGPPPFVFGPDTVVVMGRPFRDPTRPPPLLPFNEFVLPIRASGHDDRRDRRPPGVPIGEGGHILAWRFEVNCTRPDCRPVTIARANNWTWDTRGMFDPPDIDLFDDPRSFVVPLDTILVGDRFAAVIPPEFLGEHVFTLRGRDTEWVRHWFGIVDFGRNPPLTFYRDLAEEGLVTPIETRTMTWRQLADVRPITMNPSTLPLAALHSGR